MRRVQALATQQFADLARPRARVRLGQDLQLVLRRERPALGLLDQLRVRHPLPDGAPASPEPQPGYAAQVFVAGGSLTCLLSSIRARLQHVRRSPFSPSRFIDTSMVSVSPDVDREGPSAEAPRKSQEPRRTPPTNSAGPARALGTLGRDARAARSHSPSESKPE